ncbi:hypothetical protein COEREDRAFT_34306, partial [Coemansia reversa NRRL 1564]
NLTAHVQPMDAGIIHSMKCKYRYEFLTRAVKHSITNNDDVFAIDQLQAMQLIKLAWLEVTVMTITNCWYKTGIMP